MAKGALRPDVFVSSLPSFIKNKEAEKKGASTEEIQLAAMAETAGWGVFKEFTEQLKKELDQLNESAIKAGESLEDIGEKTIMVSLVKGVIAQMINKVEDARDSCGK